MANAISPQLQAKTQELHEATTALGIVIDLYMASSMQNIDNMIYIVNHLHGPIQKLSEDLNTLVREEEK